MIIHYFTRESASSKCWSIRIWKISVVLVHRDRESEKIIKRQFKRNDAY